MGRSFAAAVTLFLLTASVAAGASPACAPGASGAPSLTLQEANELLRQVGRVTAVGPAPVEGLWLIELEREGRQGQAFLDYARKNLIVGTVFPLAGANAVGGPAGGEARGGRADLAAIPRENSIVMGNPAASRKIIVFTDPDCPYCAKLHEELKKLVALEPDLGVLVKMFPLHLEAYPKARVILGSGSLELLDKAFRGEPLPQPGAGDPKQPVIDTMALGRSLGIVATPTLVLPDGELVTGTMDVASLRNLLSLHKKQ